MLRTAVAELVGTFGQPAGALTEEQASGRDRR